MKTRGLIDGIHSHVRVDLSNRGKMHFSLFSDPQFVHQVSLKLVVLDPLSKASFCWNRFKKSIHEIGACGVWKSPQTGCNTF